MRKLIVFIAAPLLLAMVSCKKDDAGSKNEMILGKWRLASATGHNADGETVVKEVPADAPSHWTFAASGKLTVDGMYDFFGEFFGENDPWMEGVDSWPYELSGDQLAIRVGSDTKEDAIKFDIKELTADVLIIGIESDYDGKIKIGFWYTFRKM